MSNDLFNEMTIKRLVSNIQLNSKQKESARKWIDMLEKGELRKEVGNYLDFYDLILRDILGYSGIKYQKENIEFSYVKDGKTLVRFEAKGTDTEDLFAKQNRANSESPKEQLWRYMNLHATPFGVVTNYKVFILFKYDVGSTKFHIFDFESIKNNIEKLKEFVAIFCKQSIDGGFIEKLVEESVIEEREFTKEFYKLFHETRLMMIKEFKENGASGAEALHNTQLFLNRLMFIFFAKDRDLVEKNYFRDKIISVVNSGIIDSHSKFISEKIKGIFEELDKDIPKQIHGFNGGLFKEKISQNMSFNDYRDEIFFKELRQNSKLREKRKISLNDKDMDSFNKHKNKINPLIGNLLLMNSFDFASEISVNILGHVFEQSLSDLEELKEGEVSKRKKEGIFYTPEYITDYICRNTIIPYLSNNGASSIKNLIEEYSVNIKELEDKFKKIKILDPACGSGAFLIKAVDVMLEIFRAIQDFKQSLGGYRSIRADSSGLQMGLRKWSEQDEIREIIENNIFGVDINEESVEITKLSLFLKLAKKNKKLPNLSENIKRGNSLVDSKKADPKSAFDWKNKEEGFGKILEGGGFDIVIGNPPYVQASAVLSNDESEKLMKIRREIENTDKYETLEGRWDLFIPFIERGIKELLKDKGNMGFIVSDSLEVTPYSKKIRNLMANQTSILEIDFFPKLKLFPGVGVQNTIFILKNEKANKEHLVNRTKYFKEDFSSHQKLKCLKQDVGGDILFLSDYNPGFEDMKLDSEYLGDICYICSGAQLQSDQEKFRGEFKKDDLISEKMDRKFNKPYIEGKDIDEFFIKRLRYVDYDSRLSKIKRPRFKELFENEKLMLGVTSGYMFDDMNTYANHSVIICVLWNKLSSVSNKSISKSVRMLSRQFKTNKSRKELEEISKCFNLKYILAILSSKLMNSYMKKNLLKSKRSLTEDTLKGVPIKKISEHKQKEFELKVDLVSKLSHELQNIRLKVISRLKYNFGVENITRKLDSFFNLNSNELVEEINKQNKKHISLKEQDELEDYFNEQKNKALELNRNIGKLKKYIDEMVFSLYGIKEKAII